MTNEELQAHIKAINAACARGEIEESRYADDETRQTEWVTSKGRRQYDFLLNPGYFRIKPQPREAWVEICGNSARTAWLIGLEDVEEVKRRRPESEWRKFREVIE